MDAENELLDIALVFLVNPGAFFRHGAFLESVLGPDPVKGVEDDDDPARKKTRAVCTKGLED